MKKYGIRTGRLFVMAMGLVLATAGGLAAQELLNIDFSAAQGYVDGFLVGQPAGAEYQWLDLVDTGISGIAAADPYLVNDEMLVIEQPGSGALWAYIMFPLQTTGELTLTWDWQYVGPDTENIDVGVNLSDTANYSLDITEGSTSGWGRQTTTVRMNQSTGSIDIHDGSGYSALVDYSYTGGELISMRFVIHVDDKTYDIYAKKEGETEVALGIGAGYRRDVQAGFDNLSMWVDGSAITECYIDNIVLTASGGAASNAPNWSLYQ